MPVVAVRLATDASCMQMSPDVHVRVCVCVWGGGGGGGRRGGQCEWQGLVHVCNCVAKWLKQLTVN